VRTTLEVVRKQVHVQSDFENRLRVSLKQDLAVQFDRHPEKDVPMHQTVRASSAESFVAGRVVLPRLEKRLRNVA
jgi:hypothetical protein